MPTTEHPVRCSTCGTSWTCLCAPGSADPAACLFDGRQCDDCALAALDAEPEPGVARTEVGPFGPFDSATFHYDESGEVVAITIDPEVEDRAAGSPSA